MSSAVEAFNNSNNQLLTAADIPPSYARPLSEQIRKLDVPPSLAPTSKSSSSNSISSFEQAKSAVGKGVKHGFNNFGKDHGKNYAGEGGNKTINASVSSSGGVVPPPAPNTSEFHTGVNKQSYEELSKNFQRSIADVEKSTNPGYHFQIANAVGGDSTGAAGEGVGKGDGGGGGGGSAISSSIGDQLTSTSVGAAYPASSTGGITGTTASNGPSPEQFQDQMQKSYAAFVSQYPANASHYMSFMDPMVMQYGAKGYVEGRAEGGVEGALPKTTG